MKVLEHSIRRFSSLPVEVIPMIDLPLRPPRDPGQDQRTGFSFSRFCIPELSGYQGKALYMDADMLVFKDIRELWELPFGEAKVLIQEPLTDAQARTGGKRGAPGKRIKQCSVMLLDCSRLDWKISDIVDGLDQRKYDYAQLMYELCLVPENEVAFRIPFRWNSLEFADASTCLIHYTDMRTQPWVHAGNPHGDLWVNELKLMIADGTLDMPTLENEVELGYARPSLLREIRSRVTPVVPAFIRRAWNVTADRLSGFRAHHVAYHDRLAHLSRLRSQAGLTAAAAH